MHRKGVFVACMYCVSHCIMIVIMLYYYCVALHVVHINSRPLYCFQFLFWFVVRGSEKTPEKVEIASVKPVSATMKPITATKPASATTTSAATTTATSIAVKRKSDAPSTPHSKRARKDGSTSGWLSLRFFYLAEWFVIEFLNELLLQHGCLLKYQIPPTGGLHFCSEHP